VLDLPMGVLAGAVAGLAGCATLACLVLAGDLVPQLLWELTLRSDSAGAGLLPVWIVLAVLCWTLLGAGLGLLLSLSEPLRRNVLAPLGQGLAWLCRKSGLKGLADFLAAT
jgi:hypothetical protein